MEKIISYPISVVYYFFFGLCLLVFHPIQWICLKIGYNAHKKSVDVLNWFLIGCTRIIGTRYTVTGREKIPTDVPLIIVANHQSLYDIISIVWFLRKVHPKFVSKKELGKGIPSVSFNLRHGGSILIDRKDARQSLPAIKGLGDYIEKFKRSAVIFPEGTRSKNGAPKEFAQTGLKILVKATPSAYVLPLTINNSWKMAKFGYFPLGLGNHLKFTVHEPISVANHGFEEIIEYTEKAVTSAIKY
ncbi:1-acyl-sn-glycerol-3-phosphate acyltransferase [Flavobacterium sp.]|uniref:lysophospholipid acyltransferase family protein n=1 Tax=Flavobacterium sp. TaxID=239 RepID=UPI001220EDE4|nr:lysophospholipid acyltransferase family protein [Flavobacterium sp.]RZJ72018.1 MAG: 1-acyl-sn-glycerol-3-phosphate acyltransferase [Flavobacterium sp.]